MLASRRIRFHCYSLVRCWHDTAVRSEFFAKVTQSDVDYFKEVVGDSGVVTDTKELEKYNRDWIGKYSGGSTVALHPKNSSDVSKLLSYCNGRSLAVVPQGGNTGLVGGSTPVFDEIVLSTKSMNKIMSFDEMSGVLVCQSGCILENLDNFVRERGYTMPLDLGAKGSCHIGGNVSTNAGGLRLLRYGSLHGSVLGLEIVLANGGILDLLQTLRKDNTGYDLKQLFIGAEGTLGVVTAVSIFCPPLPSSINACFLACKDFDAVLKVFTLAKSRLGEILSAAEFLDAESLTMALEFLEGVRNPLPDCQSRFYFLLETSGSNEERDKEKLEKFLEEVVEEGMVIDGSLAESSLQLENMWRVREGVTEALTRRGAAYKYDLSLPLKHLYGLVEVMRAKLKMKPDLKVVGYGHLGDGNLHLNVSSPQKSHNKCILAEIEPFVYEWTSERRGSISAEHGIGFMKAECVKYSKPDNAIDLMGEVKRLFDPKGILNPYKMLPTSARGG